VVSVAVVHWRLERLGAWSGWTSLGGSGISSISTTLDAHGNPEVFAVGADRAVWYQSQSPQGGWGGWQSLGGSVLSISTTRDLNGDVEVFAVGTDQTVYYQVYTRSIVTPFYTSSGWSGWNGLQGGVQSVSGICDNNDDVYVFAVATDSTVDYQEAVATPLYPSQQQLSSNWSGYAINASKGQVTAVGGSWVVPAVSGTNGQDSSTWVGIDGSTGGSTVEQIGTQQVIQNGQATYVAWYEFFGDQSPSGQKGPAYNQVNIPMNIQAGDSITATVELFSGSSSFDFFMQDTPAYGRPTQYFSQILTTQYVAPQLSTAEWIMETPGANGQPTQSPSFGSVTFSRAWATVAGNTGPIDSFPNNSAISHSSGSVTEATPGRLGDNYTADPNEYITRLGYATSTFTVTQPPVNARAASAGLNIGTVPVMLNAAAQTTGVGSAPTVPPSPHAPSRPGSSGLTRAADVAAALLDSAFAEKHHGRQASGAEDPFWQDVANLLNAHSTN
jgi:hypothetical protein